MNWQRRAQWGIEYGIYRLLEKLVGSFSLSQVGYAGSRFGDLAWHLVPGRREAVIKNLRTAFAEERSELELELLARRVFQKAGENLFAALRTAQLNAEELKEVITVRNKTLMDEALAEGKGIILLVPHMSNWEALAQFTFVLPPGSQAGTHYRPLNNVYLNTLVIRRRQRQGTRLFAKTSSPHTLAAFLRENGVLGILADQRASRGGHFASYYGRFSSCSSLPEILATRTGAAVLALSLRGTEAGKWEASFHPVPTPDTPGCMSALELATRTSPADVFWLQDRWRLDGKHPYTRSGKEHPNADPADAEKPFRVLYREVKPALPENHRSDLLFEEGPADLFSLETPESHIAPLLRSISMSKPLPLDAVHDPDPSPILRKACKRLSIQLITLPLS